MFCIMCGSVLNSNQRFCAKCGTAADSACGPATTAPGSTGSAGPKAAAEVPRTLSQLEHSITARCVAGTDMGKAYHVGTQAIMLGKRERIGITDPDVAEDHVMLSVRDGKLWFQTLPGHQLYVNTLPQTEGSLSPGQQFRLGSSTWQVESPAVRTSFLNSITNRLHRLTSTDKLEGFSLSEMFSDIFKKRTAEEVEDYFLVGTSRTTPRIEDVQTGWPQPWFFLRVLIFFTLLYVGFYFAIQQWANSRLLPGLMVMGSFATPLAVVILLFELNTPRNVSLQKVLMLLLFGGVVSLIVALFGFDVSPLEWLGPPSAGVVEETAKLLTVVLIVRSRNYKYILNGLLFGAAVGAGFAVFESAGYGFSEPMKDFPADFLSLLSNGVVFKDAISIAMGHFFAYSNSIVLDRGYLAPFGHVAWTAITAAALWRVKGPKDLSLAMLRDQRFWKPFLLAVGLHMTWNSVGIFAHEFLPKSQWPLFAMGMHVAIGLVAWYVIFAFVQLGLRQVKQEQVEHLESTIAQVQSRAAAAGESGARSVA